jgi:hypothetical protein
MDMWKPNSCPIAAETRPWWKDPSLEDMARKYWRKKSYLFQGFVPQNPNKDDNTPENPIRRFIINPSVFDVVKGILMRQDLENSPTDYANGRDFYLSKTTKGGYANYASSSWSMKERALHEDEMGAIEKFGLYSLNQFLPKKPDDEHLNAIVEMFHASVNEELYDAERWGQFYRPSGMRMEGGEASEATPSAPVTKPVTANSILERAAAALGLLGVPYAVVGGNAVAAWVSRVDVAAVRNTRDVDILLRREDADRARTALEAAGFHFDKDIATGLAIPVVAVLVWYGLRRFRRSLERAAAKGDSAGRPRA